MFTTQEANAYTALIVTAIHLGIMVRDGWKALIGALRSDLTPEQIDAGLDELAVRAEIRAALREAEAAKTRAALEAQDDGA